MPQIIIQHLATTWTKRSRGGDGARKRNAVPDAVVFPSIGCDQPFVLHSAAFSEGRDYVQIDSLKSSTTFDVLGLKFLALDVNEGELAVRFFRDGYNLATPSPYPHKDPFTLRVTEWGRIVHNGRYTDWDTGNWFYEKHVYNIGLFVDWSPDIFVRTRPHGELRQMAKLR